MHIAIVATNNLSSAAPAVARELGRGHEVTVYTRDDAQIKGVRVERVPAGPDRELAENELLPYISDFSDGLKQRWNAERPDVIHAHSWSGGLAAIAGSDGLDVPVTQTFHHDDRPSAQVLRLERAIGRRARAVIAACAGEESQLIQMGVPRRNISIVPRRRRHRAVPPPGPGLPPRRPPAPAAHRRHRRRRRGQRADLRPRRRAGRGRRRRPGHGAPAHAGPRPRRRGAADPAGPGPPQRHAQADPQRRRGPVPPAERAHRHRRPGDHGLRRPGDRLRLRRPPRLGGRRCDRPSWSAAPSRSPPASATSSATAPSARPSASPAPTAPAPATRWSASARSCCASTRAPAPEDLSPEGTTRAPAKLRPSRAFGRCRAFLLPARPVFIGCGPAHGVFLPLRLRLAGPARRPGSAP